MSGTWVGLGCGIYGSECSDDHPLIQAGTEEDVNPNGEIIYSFFYQIWPDKNNPFPPLTDGSNLSLKVGDEVAATVFWMPQTTAGQNSICTLPNQPDNTVHVGNTAQLGVCNFTENKCVNIYIPCFTDQNSGAVITSVPEPDTAEWVHEAPTDKYQNPQAIPVFDQINFNNACWAPTTTYAIQGIGNSAELVGSVACQIITAGSIQRQIQMLYDFPGTSYYQMATPSGIGATGSDFYINYNQ
jgi:hypothetical protein